MYRGRVDVGVNGTYWAGSIIGTLVSLAFLNWVGAPLGWRLGFLVGPALAPAGRAHDQVPLAEDRRSSPGGSLRLARSPVAPNKTMTWFSGGMWKGCGRLPT